MCVPGVFSFSPMVENTASTLDRHDAIRSMLVRAPSKIRTDLLSSRPGDCERSLGFERT